MSGVRVPPPLPQTPKIEHHIESVDMDRYEKFEFDEKFILRLKTYLDSEQFSDIPTTSKSDYWLENSCAIDIKFDGNFVSVSGKSGFYLPPETALQNIPIFCALDCPILLFFIKK